MVPYTDIANTMMDRRNALQRKRRAEMTNEQLEEKRRKNVEYQRQYRARKKAELQNNSTTSNADQDNAGIIVEPSLPAGKNVTIPYPLMHFDHRFISSPITWYITNLS
jgi:hypothetical protein